MQLTEADLAASARVADAVSAAPAGREARMARWAKVRGKTQKDGTPGEYVSDDEKSYVDPIKGGPDAAFKGGEEDLDTDAEHTSHDLKSKHKS